VPASIRCGSGSIRQAAGAQFDAAGRDLRDPTAKSQQVTAGQIGMPPTPAAQAFQYTLNVTAGSTTRTSSRTSSSRPATIGDVTRVRDVGSVELGAQTYSQMFSLNNKPAPASACFQSPGANALESRRRCRRRWPKLAKQFPADIKYDTPFDTTKFVSESIKEVYKTLIEAGLLVLVVILIFLQDWRAMLVPATTVPVTIIGAFCRDGGARLQPSTSRPCLRSCWRSNRGRRRHRRGRGRRPQYRKGMSSHDAAISAMDALFAPIGRHHAGVDLGVPAVGVPAGVDGPDVLAFALVIAATALLSAVNAATLKPTAVRLMAAPAGAAGAAQLLLPCFNAVYNRLERGLCRADRSPGRAQQSICYRSPHPDRSRRLRPVAGADRLHSDRGSGYLLVGGAAARWCCARPHPARARSGQRTSPAKPRASISRHHCGISALDNSSSLANAVSPI